MNHNEAYLGEPGGPIAYLASNRVAANLFMLGILAAGLVSLSGLDREAWSTVPFHTVEVSMAYPGATPEEVEESIVDKIEEQVEALEDVRAVKSVAAAGMASVRVEMACGTDMSQAVDEVESAVGLIQSFPAAAERPEFREMTNHYSMMRLIVFGDIPERSLKELAYQIDNELASLPEVSRVESTATRPYEVSIEVPLLRLRALGLTLDDLAGAVRRGSLDLSAGRIDTRDGHVRVRTRGQSYDQQDFEETIVLSGKDGTAVRLSDIADVRDSFQSTDQVLRHQGQPAAFVEVFLAESLFILPNHLSHLHGPEWAPSGAVDRFFARSQRQVDRTLEQFLDSPLAKALRLATDQPAVVIASVIGLFVLSISLVPSGIVATTFADVVEGDFVTATLEMPAGTPAQRTYEVATELEQAGRRVLERLERERPDDAPPLLTGVTITVGQGPRVEGGGLDPTPTLNPQANVAAIEFKLLSAQQRDLSTIAIVQAWRRRSEFFPTCVASPSAVKSSIWEIPSKPCCRTRTRRVSIGSPALWSMAAGA